MRWKALLAALALVVLTNAWVLVGVARNRTGEPDAVLELNEREFGLRRGREENTGVSLYLRTSVSSYGFYDLGGKDRWTSEAWFDRAKLEELGFDCSKPLDDPDAFLFYGKALPKEVLAVAEFGGAAWKDWEEAEKKNIADLLDRFDKGHVEEREYRVAVRRFARASEERSRLIVIDAGLDPEELREKYPERNQYLILPAVARLHADPMWEGGKERKVSRLEGRLSRILVADIHVPMRHRPVLDSLPPPGDEDGSSYRRIFIDEIGEETLISLPRYAVTLKVGRRHEPWIDSIRSLEPGETE